MGPKREKKHTKRLKLIISVDRSEIGIGLGLDASRVSIAGLASEIPIRRGGGLV
jgi:hypothetical protein